MRLSGRDLLAWEACQTHGPASGCATSAAARAVCDDRYGGYGHAAVVAISGECGARGLESHPGVAHGEQLRSAAARVTAAESLGPQRIGSYSAYLPALEAAYVVGHAVVNELIWHWKKYASEEMVRGLRRSPDSQFDRGPHLHRPRSPLAKLRRAVQNACVPFFVKSSVSKES